MEKSGYGKDGIFRSLRPPLKLPKHENANMVSFMFRDSSSYAHRLALADADSGEELSFRDFKEKVNVVGSALSQLGIRKGDVVLLFSPNSANVPSCFLGIVSIGAVATTVNPLYTAMEVAKQVQDSKSKLIITVPELWDKVKDLDLPTIVIGGNGHIKRTSSPIISFSEVLTMGAQKNPPEVMIKQTDTAALLYSSGTTGANKGVVLTHRNFMASALMVTSDQELKGERHMTYLCLLPMFHVYGMACVLYGQLQRGNAVVSMGKFTFVGMLEAIQKYKITQLPLVPPIVTAIAKEKIVARYDLSSLKKVMSGAAPLGKDIMEECAKRVPQAEVIQVPSESVRILKISDLQLGGTSDPELDTITQAFRHLNEIEMEKSGYGKDGIFRSLRASIKLPRDENVSMVSFMFRDSLSYAHKLALADADSGEKLSFRDFKDKVSMVASGLSQLGIRKGDVVLLFSPNSIYFPLCFFGIVSIGAVATTVNPLYTAMEVAKQVQDSKVKLIIAVPELWDKVKDLGLPAIVIGADGDCKGASSPIFSFSKVLKMGVQKSAPEVIIKQTDTAALLYSSGTTGTNKGAVLTHRNFMAAGLMATSDQEMKGESHFTCLCLLPMFHVYGLSCVIYGQLQRGNAVVSMGKFSFVRMLEVIQEYKITHLPIVPPIVIAVAKEKIVARYDLSSLKEVVSGAAPLGKDIMEECANKIPQTRMIQGYGLTESCGIATIAFPKEGNSHFGSAGTLVPGLEAKIVNLEKGKSLPPNQRGEVWLRGPNIMIGYFNNPSATKMTLDNEGWLHTGDMGYFDEEGGLFIVDRIKELIKYKGFQVAPAELEGLLLTHPQIADAGVIPLPDLKAGEVPIAYVVRTPGSSLSEKEVMDYVAKQVAPFKRLHRVNFVDSIPKSSSGKILRRELIAKAKSKL